MATRCSAAVVTSLGGCGPARCDMRAKRKVMSSRSRRASRTAASRYRSLSARVRGSLTLLAFLAGRGGPGFLLGANVCRDGLVAEVVLGVLQAILLLVAECDQLVRPRRPPR